MLGPIWTRCPTGCVQTGPLLQIYFAASPRPRPSAAQSARTTVTDANHLNPRFKPPPCLVTLGSQATRRLAAPSPPSPPLPLRHAAGSSILGPPSPLPSLAPSATCPGTVCADAPGHTHACGLPALLGLVLDLAPSPPPPPRAAAAPPAATTLSLAPPPNAPSEPPRAAQSSRSPLPSPLGPLLAVDTPAKSPPPEIGRAHV